MSVDRSGKDVMGYTRKSGLTGYTDDDIGAARMLARNKGYEWDCVLEDPRVTGKRFLEQAKIVRESLEALGWRKAE